MSNFNFSSNNMMGNNMGNFNSNFASPPPQQNFNNFQTPPQNFTPPQDSNGYQSFKIGCSSDFGYNIGGGNLHVMTEQFGQGILLKHDLSTRRCLVQLARDCDGVSQIELPGSQITIHTQHRVMSFEDFLMEEEQRAAATANAQNQGQGGCGGNKRQRDCHNNDLHAENSHAAANHHAARFREAAAQAQQQQQQQMQVQQQFVMRENFGQDQMFLQR